MTSDYYQEDVSVQESDSGVSLAPAIVALISGFLITLSAFLPWLRIPPVAMKVRTFALSGMRGGSGWQDIKHVVGFFNREPGFLAFSGLWAILLGIVGTTAALSLFGSRKRRRLWVLFFIGIMGNALFLVDTFTMDPLFRPAEGLWMLLVASLVMLGVSVFLLVDMVPQQISWTGKAIYLTRSYRTHLMIAGALILIGVIVAGFIQFKSDSRVAWTFETGVSDTPDEFGTSPCVSDKSVFFGSLDQNFYALELKTGKTIWKLNTGDKIRSSPQIADGVVYFSNSDNGYAVDTETGKVKHTYKYGFDEPVVINGLLYTANGDLVYALDVKTGKRKWEFNGNIVCSDAIVGDGIVCFGESGGVRALDAATGQPLWKYELRGLMQINPLVYNGIVFFNYDNDLFALEAITGAERWRLKGKGGTVSPFALEDALYQCSNFSIYALDIETGREKWVFKTAKDRFNSPPRVADGVVFCAAQTLGSFDKPQFMYSIDARSGKELWKFKVGGEIHNCRPAYAKGMVYFGSKNHVFYALEAR